MKCENCGKEFDQKYHTQRFCCRKCKEEVYSKDYYIKKYKEKYLLNPKRCKYCNSIIPYEKRRNTFCNSSCSASFNNCNRVIKRRSNTGIKKRRVCKVCNDLYFYTKGINTKICCSKECSDYLRTHRINFLSEQSIQKLRLSGLKSSQIQKESRRSKNEIYFCELCKNKFQKVTHNDPIFNGWDADVIIHDLKIAVLWNGVWHRKKITKNHSVEQVQNRDAIKIREIENCGLKEDRDIHAANNMIEFYNRYIQSVGTIDLKPRAKISYNIYKNLCRQEAQLSLATE